MSGGGDTPPRLDCAALNAHIAQSPGNRWLGLQALSITSNTLMLRLPWRAELGTERGRDGIDAGALAFAMNAALGYLLLGLDGVGGAIADLRFDPLEPAPVDDVLLISRLRKLGGRLSSVSVEALDRQGRKLALASGSYFMAAPAR
ncbi:MULTISPECIES: PaaI family thioesterase [Hydrocarboniphaga]|uniref:Thioesterase domain-containing protein n=1 Tax=Hydrocarboniphaga effusa AP103 TaxID=1172194 RepID=I8TAL6_9GAMM|nr:MULTISPECIES: hypothetical protein [Hydrocarboniphaga]EIT70770.1 hypothetical protein WQQ_09070 [Hydrocarboniphaga effusa AP103]MDZ4079855.1 hypothetical protein [Hydrocarboniphaga sp.]